MRSSLPAYDLPIGISGVACCVVGIAAAIFVVKLFRPSRLDGIPTVGSSSWLGSWWAGLTYLTNAQDILRAGYEKHKPAPFKVAALRHWLVILNSRKHVEELRKVPDDTFSLMEAQNEIIQYKYTFGPEFQLNPSQFLAVAPLLTRNIGTLYSEIRDEIIRSFDGLLDLRGNEWKSVRAVSIVQKLVCRATNRAFVGSPLCRDPDWIDFTIGYSSDLVIGATIIGLFPDFLKPIAARFFTSVNQNIQRGRKFLGAIIEERKRLDKYENEWTDKPDDCLSWLMEETGDSKWTVESLTTCILATNFAAIHTTSISFTHALLHLAANPQYIQPLREEVEATVEGCGWSKPALDKMRKLDSFLKECQRMEGTGITSMARRAMKDFTFSDGTFIPEGAMITVSAQCIHHDEAFYEDARTFKPFRFANLHEEHEDDLKNQFVSTTTEYLPFGHGRHACPGRFFAAVVLKSMLAHVVITYDVKLIGNPTRPLSLHLAGTMLPDPKAEVMFRKRVD